MNQKKRINTLMWALITACLFAPLAATAEEVSNVELHERIQALWEKVEYRGGWLDRISFGGVIEAEAGYAEEDDDGDETSASDFMLADVELGLNVDVVKHVSGHIVFLYEQGEMDEAVLVDEGFITLNGEDVIPFYLKTGKFNVPFGNYAAYLLSDPLTQEIGETGQTALMVGLTKYWIEAAVAVFNGDVDNADEQNDHLDTFVLKVAATLPEHAVSGFGLSGGLSYISSIADTDGLEEAFEDDGISLERDDVAGFGGWISISLLETFFLEAEYITALESFNADDLGLGEDRLISAWNLELAFAPIEKLTIAARYGRTTDAEGFFPELQYGAAVTYDLLKNTSLGIEYLKNDFEDNAADTLITARLAIEF